MGMVHEELEQVFTEAMGQGHGVKASEMQAKWAQIIPMFESMPKSVHGRVDREALQYMVRRYFGSGHGWSVKGFEPTKETNSSSDSVAAVSILKHKLPLYIESLLESKLDHAGFSATDVVTMVAVLERMIFDEGVEMLEGAYRMRGWSAA